MCEKNKANNNFPWMQWSHSARGTIFSENEVIRVWILRVFVVCGFLRFFEKVGCFEERV